MDTEGIEVETVAIEEMTIINQEVEATTNNEEEVTNNKEEEVTITSQEEEVIISKGEEVVRGMAAQDKVAARWTGEEMEKL